MVKVVKVAAWRIGDRYIESAKEAERETRKLVIRELMAEDNASAYEDEADYMAHHWETIDKRVKEAMAGT